MTEIMCPFFVVNNDEERKLVEDAKKQKDISDRLFESEPIASKTETIIGNQIIQANYHESDVDVKGIAKEVTWESIFNEWDKKNHPNKNESSVFLIWLSTHFNIPTKKQ